MLFLGIILFLLIPALEIYVFIQVGGEIGAGTVIWLTIFTALLGLWVVKQQGIHLLIKARSKMESDQVPANEMFEGLCLILAGAFTFLPGFVTDSLGILLLIPPVRLFLRTVILDEMLGMYTFGFVDTDTVKWGRDKYKNYRSSKEDDIVDADFEVISNAPISHKKPQDHSDDN